MEQTYEFIWIDLVPDLTTIPYQTGYNAYRNISHDPERRAMQEQNSWVNGCKEFLGIVSKHVYTPEQEAIVRAAFPEIHAKALSKYLSYLGAKSRTASTMITGPANFPVRRNEKAMSSERNRYNEYSTFVDRAKEGLIKQLKAATTPEVKLEQDWQLLKKHMLEAAKTIKDIDNGDKTYTRSLFVKSITSFPELAAEHGHVELYRRCIVLLTSLNTEAALRGKPIITEQHKVWYMQETVKMRAASKEAEPTVIKTIEVLEKYENDVYIQNNHELERVQIMFPDKPTDEIRKALKDAAFKWSPTNNAWQRQNTLNGIRAAENIVGRFYKKA